MGAIKQSIFCPMKNNKRARERRKKGFCERCETKSQECFHFLGTPIPRKTKNVKIVIIEMYVH